MDEAKRSPRQPISRLLWRCLGFGIGGLYLAMGTLVLYVLLIGGLWEGFGRASYVAMFLAMVVYVYATACVAFYFGLRPNKLSGVVLTVLLIPALALMLSTESTRSEQVTLAQDFVHASDPQQREAARHELLTLGQRAGQQAHVSTLLDELAAAETDSQRRRIVCLIGQLSHQHGPVIDALKALQHELGDDPQRALLSQEIQQSLLLTEPQAIERWQDVAQLRDNPEACRYE